MQNGEMGDREASVFHRYTAYLAQRAGGIVLRWTIVSGVLGLALGAVTLTHWAHWPVSHDQGYFVAALGAVCGAFLGRAIGSGRAQMILFQAQLAQHQHDFERRLLAVSASVQARAEAQPQPAPQPQPEAVAPPLPAAPAAAVPEPEPAPVYLPEPGLALPELPTLPEPEPAFVAEPVAPQPAAAPPLPEPAAYLPQPEPAPAEVVQLVPRPEEPAPQLRPQPLSEPVAAAGFAVEPAPVSSVLSLPAFSPVGVPPLSGESAAPATPDAALDEGDSAGYGWQPEVNGQ